MKKYYEEVDILKGIAIILVIIGHAVIIYPINLHKINWCNYLLEFVSIAHVPLFFLVSGFCFSYRNKTYKDHIKSKIFRIFIPYVVFSLIDLIPRILLQAFVNRPTNLSDGIKKILLYGGEYWFLYVLFIIFIIYPLFFKGIICKNKKSYNIALLTVLVVMQFIKFPNILLIDKVMEYLLFFTLGNLIKEHFGGGGRYIENKINFKVNMVMEFIIFAFMLSYSINLGYIRNNNILHSILRLLFELTGCYFWFVIAKCIVKSNEIIKKPFLLCGKYSLQLYLFNGYLLVISRVFVVNLLKITNPLIIIFFNTVIPITATLLILYIIHGVINSHGVSQKMGW